MRTQIEEGYSSLNSLQDVLPDQISQMLVSLEVMKSSSQPDESADYWEDRHKIEVNCEKLNKIKDKFDAVLNQIMEKKTRFYNMDSSIYYS